MVDQMGYMALFHSILVQQVFIERLLCGRHHIWHGECNQSKVENQTETLFSSKQLIPRRMHNYNWRVCKREDGLWPC